MGRKSKNSIILEKVFDELRRGQSLYASCLKAKISTADFYEMLATDAGAKILYQLALSDYADQCMDNIKKIAENLKAGEIDNSTAKLLIETEKWLAGKACPEPFGGKATDDEVEERGAQEIVVRFV